MHNVLSRLEALRDTGIHVTEVLCEVGGCGPLSWLWEGVAFVFSFVPDLDEGVFCWWVGGDVDERGTFALVSM